MDDVIGTKMFYSIKEVAILLSESESTLRYWESEFPEVISPRRNDGGTRFYAEKDIDAVNLIRYLLRERLLTLDGARKVLKNNKEDAAKQAKVVQHLEKIRNELKLLEDAFDEVDKIKNLKS